MIQRAKPETTAVALALILETDQTRVTRNQAVRFTASLFNFGEEPLILVEPGDGSEAGWRTPAIGWSVRTDQAPMEPHPDEPKLRPARGANVNPLSTDEIFTLLPGETRCLSEWIDAPRLGRPGRYRVVMYYRNDPWAPLMGLPFDEHDPVALDLLRMTTPCTLVSNEVAIEVTE